MGKAPLPYPPNKNDRKCKQWRGLWARVWADLWHEAVSLPVRRCDALSASTNPLERREGALGTKCLSLTERYRALHRFVSIQGGRLGVGAGVEWHHTADNERTRSCGEFGVPPYPRCCVRCLRDRRNRVLSMQCRLSACDSYRCCECSHLSHCLFLTATRDLIGGMR